MMSTTLSNGRSHSTQPTNSTITSPEGTSSSLAEDLLATLLAIQNQHHLSDRAFARTLGISPSLWGKTRSGKSPIGQKVLRGAAQAFPHLKDDIFSHLTEQTNRPRRSQSDDIEPNTEP